jgi:hypothetical protein
MELSISICCAVWSARNESACRDCAALEEIDDVVNGDNFLAFNGAPPGILGFDPNGFS